MATLLKTNRYQIGLTIPKSNYENFCYVYGRDMLSKFLNKAIEKAVARRDFFEYTIFDDPDDFNSTRTVLMKRGDLNG